MSSIPVTPESSHPSFALPPAIQPHTNNLLSARTTPLRDIALTQLTFREHPAEEVYVTGTFDDWTKSIKLDKDGDIFQKTVDLKNTSNKTYYKVSTSAEFFLAKHVNFPNPSRLSAPVSLKNEN